MPVGRHNVRTTIPRGGDAGVRARYVRPMPRTVYAPKQSLDTVLISEKAIKNDIAGAMSSQQKLRKVPASQRNIQLKPALPRQSRSAVLARHAIKRKPTTSVSRKIKQINIRRYVFWVMAVLFCVSSVFGYIGWRSGEQHKHVVLAKNTDEATSDSTLSEKEVMPAVVAGYEVEAELPRLIKIPSLQIDARIKRMVAGSNGELTAPRNINDAGWYDGSVMPGEPGTSLIVGHVFGNTKPGIFNRISNLIEGDTIQIERGDGKMLDFTIYNIERFNQEEINLDKALISHNDSKPSLHLLTHSGRYDVRTNKYEKRILIRAVQK